VTEEGLTSLSHNISLGKIFLFCFSSLGSSARTALLKLGWAGIHVLSRSDGSAVCYKLLP